MAVHRVRRKGQISRVHLQLKGENPGEEEMGINQPVTGQETGNFQFNSLGGPLDKGFKENFRRD